MSCGKEMKLNISIEFHLPFFFYFGSSNLFLPGISKIWLAFGHWPGQEKIIFFLGAQTGDKNFLQTNGVFLC